MVAFVFIAAFVVAAPPGSAEGETLFVLENGGSVRGRWLNADRRPGEPYRLAAQEPVAMECELAESQVKEVRRRRPVESEYDRMAPGFTDTPEGQWQAAEWCRQRGLKAYRDYHLRRLVELNPNHARAWSLLGYAQINGRWKRRADLEADLGYEFHEGRWRLAQEIELLEERQRIEAERLAWRQRVFQWHDMMRRRDRAAEGQRLLSEIRDPLAVPALQACLAREALFARRVFLVNVLSQIPGPESFDAVVLAALGDPHIEVFHAAADRILKRNSPLLVERLCQCLQDPLNFRVNRAAYLLGRLEDRSAVGPLIRSLATRHVVANPARSAANADAISLSVAKDGDGNPRVGSFQTGADDQPATVVVWTANPEVHAALLKLTGQDFGYHQSMWLQWHAASNRSAKSGDAKAAVTSFIAKPQALAGPQSAIGHGANGHGANGHGANGRSAIGHGANGRSAIGHGGADSGASPAVAFGSAVNDERR